MSRFKKIHWGMLLLLTVMALCICLLVSAEEKPNGYTGSPVLTPRASLPSEPLSRNPDNQLVGYWKFDEGAGNTAYDASGCGNHGTLMNGPVWVDGISGKALEFDGTNDYVLVPDSPSLKPDQFTLEAWVNIPVEAEPDWPGDWIFGKECDHQGYGLSMWGKEPVAVVCDPESGPYDLRSGVEISLNQWHFIASSYDGTTLKVYVNAEFSESVEHAFTNVDQPLVIGAWYYWTYASRFLNGKIDEVKLYARALSAEEIWEEYEKASLVADWKFDEGAGTVAYDSSLYGNHGTVHGATYVDGKIGKALDFDGIDDNVEIPDAPSLDLKDALTITMWFKPDSSIYPSFPQYYNLLGKWHGVGDQSRTGYLMTLNAYSTGQLRLGLGFGNGQWNYLASQKDTWDADRWYSIAATYDRFASSGNIKIYVDGALDTLYDENRVIATNTLSLYINIDPYELWHEGNAYFPGLIDEVKIYSRALSEDRIMQQLNLPPGAFSLLLPEDGIALAPVVTFDWENATDPNPADTVRYDLYVSTSSIFDPDSTVVHDGLLTSEYSDDLDVGTHYWKVKAYDKWGAVKWSNEAWSFYVFLNGDANGDGEIGLSDVVYLINYVLKAGDPPVPVEAGDVNCDGNVDVIDVVYLINYLFKGGPPPC